MVSATAATLISSVFGANLRVIEACEALPGFESTLTGGDGNDIQLCTGNIFQSSFRCLIYFNLDFVGYWPQHNTVVVSHEGTDPTQL